MTHFQRLVLRALSILIQLALPTPTRGYDPKIIELTKELDEAASRSGLD